MPEGAPLLGNSEQSVFVADAGSFDIEDLWSPTTDRFRPSLLVVECPVCGHDHRPLISPHTRTIWSGSRWVGCDYTQPEADYEARCPRTKDPYKFTTFVPQ